MRLPRFQTIIYTAIVTGCIAFTFAESTLAQGRYVGRYSRADVSRIINRLEQSSDAFRRDFDRAMDNSSINGTNAEERFNRNVADYENSLDRLRREYDRQDNWWESRANVQNVIRDAEPVNRMMNTIAFRRQLENRWNRMRTDLNTLADTYDLPGIGGGGWTGGGNWGGGNIGGQITPPNWARGTFYGSSPNDGTRIMLTISDNGQVSANIGGNVTYGYFTRGNILNIDGNTSRVVRRGNGIRTVSTTDGQTINYTRSNNWGGGGWDPGPGTGNTSMPPSWATGSFYGRAPDGTGITLTIDRNGRVTAQIGNNVDYGSYYNGIITINANSSRVTQTRNGIRTTSTSDGAVINYRRN